MKNGSSVKIKGALDADALRTLRALPGVTAEEDAGSARGRVDAVITVGVHDIPVAVEYKSRVNAGTARQLVAESDELGGLPLLVVARQMTSDARTLLRAHGIGFVDAHGHAHLELPGILIHVEGEPATARQGIASPPVRLSGKAGIVAQALLIQHERPWKLTDLAEESDVSVGLVHRVVTRLEEEGIVRAEGAGPSRVRHVADASALLDLWAEEQTDQPHRTRGYLLSQTSERAIRQLGTNLTTAGIDYALTGAAGASLMAAFVTAVPIMEVWVAATEAPEMLYAASHVEPVESGHNVVFLQDRGDAPLRFRRQLDDVYVVNPFRLYVDLRRNPQRGAEQAAHLRREVMKI